MNIGFVFFFNSILLGIGLAMDAFSVSLANGLNEPCMKRGKTFFIAGIFAFFQALMPLLGWVCVHTVVEYFGAIEKYIPIIALVLLVFIGGKM
ncbi:MAG: manganese efflux pump, partial [Clostridia bacterium]|nr:manganese efflux pump [Clostridia bacterium]